MDENTKQNFLKLLEYQKKDIELRKINDALNRDEALIIMSMNKNKRAFGDAKAAIAECDKVADQLIDAYTEIQKYIDDNEALFAEFEAAGTVSDEELETRVRKLESVKSKFQSAEKKLHELEEKARTVCNKRADAIKSGNAAKAKYAEAKTKHGKLAESKAGDIKRLTSELSALRDGLRPELYAEYEKLVSDNKFPPVVRAAGDEKKNMFNCGGCGLGLPQQGNAQLLDSGWCRCDNCHRLIVHLD